jgi:predicted PurR-regulated permease PerM
VLVVALIITGMVLLLRADNDTTARVRDVFIIFMALESLVIGVALVVLIVQLATLINLLNNEIRPIINSTNETVNTIKGTVTFLSDNLSEPVIKLNEYIAGISKFFEIMRIGRR